MSRRTRRTRGLLGVALSAALAGSGLAAGNAPAAAAGRDAAAAEAGQRSGKPKPVRFATFNASLNRSAEGELVADLSTPDDQQGANVAEIIQRTRPDVLLINEFDYDEDWRALRLFQRNYLSVAHNGARPIYYPHRFTAPSNTGIPSGHDLDNDGSVSGPNDAFGFGFFPGQYGMAVYSKHPIRWKHIRTFQHFLWKDMPGALLPDDPETPEPADWYSPAELADFRLSSKSHWDVPVRVRGRTVHFLVAHPTPPVFDGPEDRNGTRNHDEIRLFADYVRPARSGYIYDDNGRYGGLRRGAHFVIAGDMNSDPHDGDSIAGSAQLLLNNPRVISRRPPDSRGAVEAARLQGGANLEHETPHRVDTANFADTDPGNLRVDYVLPDRGQKTVRARVFWPRTESPLYRLTGDYDPSLPGGHPSSDHRLVWVDLKFRH